MKKKALALAVAGAFFAPASYAAQDTSGMQYTSAAEGFYASIRTKFATEDSKDGGATVDASSSRFGVRGSNDLGNGLKGFYQYEAGFGQAQKGNPSLRVGQVGLEGAFGRVWAGSGWVETYNMVYGSTDIANNGSGSLVYDDIRPGRDDYMIQYRTPDISGFQGALGIKIQGGSDNDGYKASPTWSETFTGTGGNRVKGEACTPNSDLTPYEYERCVGGSDPSDDNNVEMWTAAAKYSVQGFTGAFAYSVRPDVGGEYKKVAGSAYEVPAGKKEDRTAWTARLGYAQDNWYVTGWHGKDNDSDLLGVGKDTKHTSIAGGVSVGKVNMYAVWEKTEHLAVLDDATTVIGVQYNLGSRSRVWMDYVGKDLDTDATAEDHINIGLRHDF